MPRAETSRANMEKARAKLQQIIAAGKEKESDEIVKADLEDVEDEKEKRPPKKRSKKPAKKEESESESEDESEEEKEKPKKMSRAEKRALELKELIKQELNGHMGRLRTEVKQTVQSGVTDSAFNKVFMST